MLSSFLFFCRKMLDPEDVETIAVVTGACLVAVVIGMVAKNSPPWWNIGLFFDWVVAAVAGGGAALVNNYAGTTKRFDSCVQMAANISMQTNNTVAPSRQVCGEQWNNNLGFPKSDDEMITDGELVVIGVLVSVGLFSGSLIYFTKVAVPLDQKPRGWSVWHDQHNAYLALALAAAITELVYVSLRRSLGLWASLSPANTSDYIHTLLGASMLPFRLLTGTRASVRVCVSVCACVCHSDDLIMKDEWYEAFRWSAATVLLFVGVCHCRIRAAAARCGVVVPFRARIVCVCNDDSVLPLLCWQNGDLQGRSREGLEAYPRPVLPGHR